jgi:hypothetical protein
MAVVRRRHQSVSGEATRAIEPEHGTTAQHGSQQSVYCARCHRWQVVEVDPELALQIHEVTAHRP